MKFQDLIVGEYYKHIWGTENEYTWYFKLDGIKYVKSIPDLSTSYYIENGKYKEMEHKEIFFSADEHDYFTIISIDEIVDYLPDTCIDKINYNRRIKIKFLLDVL